MLEEESEDEDEDVEIDYDALVQELHDEPFHVPWAWSPARVVGSGEFDGFS